METNILFIISGFGQVKTISGPSAATMNIKHIIKICIISGLGFRQFLDQALRLGQARGPSTVDTCSNEHENGSN